MKLYELTNEYLQALNNDDSFETLESIKEDFEDKAIAVASYIQNLEAEAIAIKSAIEEMTERKKRLETKSENLRGYLTHQLHLSSVRTITKSPYFVIKLRKCPEMVEVVDEVKIPDEYWSIKTTKQLDKKKIKDEMQNGVIIEGAILTHRLTTDIK